MLFIWLAQASWLNGGGSGPQPLYTQFGAVEFGGGGDGGDFVEVGGEDAAAGHDGDAAGGLHN